MKTRAEYSRAEYDKLRILPGEPRRAMTDGHECKYGMSLTQVASIMGISKQAVHQSERRALRKLREALLPHLKEINHELYEALCK